MKLMNLMYAALLVLLATGCGPAAFRLTQAPNPGDSKIFACPAGSAADCTAGGAQGSLLQPGAGGSSVAAGNVANGNIPAAGTTAPAGSNVTTMGSSAPAGSNLPAAGNGTPANGSVSATNASTPSGSSLPVIGGGGAGSGLPSTGMNSGGGSSANLPSTGMSGGTTTPVAGMGAGSSNTQPSSGGSSAGLPATGGMGSTGGNTVPQVGGLTGGHQPMGGNVGGGSTSTNAGHQPQTSTSSSGGTHNQPSGGTHNQTGGSWPNSNTNTSSNTHGTGGTRTGGRNNEDAGDSIDDLLADPLVIHLSTDASDRLYLTSPENGVVFDILGAKAQHVPKQTAWLATPSYMFITLPKNGFIGGIDDLFGNNSVGPDGQIAANGFDALAKFDANHDGVIDARDPVFSHLRLWSDKNFDGVAQASELFTLQEMGVTRLDLIYDPSYSETDLYGNTAKLKSAGHGSQGESYMLFDLWLQYK